MKDQKIKTAEELTELLLEIKRKNPERALISIMRDAMKYKHASNANWPMSDEVLLGALRFYIRHNRG